MALQRNTTCPCRDPENPLAMSGTLWGPSRVGPSGTVVLGSRQPVAGAARLWGCEVHARSYREVPLTQLHAQLELDGRDGVARRAAAT